MGLFNWVREKLNPAQIEISRGEGDLIYSDPKLYTFQQAYDSLVSVRRGADMIINGAASFDFSVMDKINGITPVKNGVRKTKVATLLNYECNLYIDCNKFRRLLYTDLLLEGNAFIYFDGAYLYNIPASEMEILTDKSTYIKGFRYSNIDFKADEIILISDNSSTSIYRGTPRLKASSTTLATRANMSSFQGNFFKNGAVPGLVLKSPNVLGDKIKQRLIESWQREYSPTKGGKRPLILDGGLEVQNIADVNFRELDFEASISNKDRELLTALGVPPILLEGGNNANIAPNLRLLYLETILPIVRKVNSAFERYFGYNLEPETAKVSALQPDMKESAAYFSTLVNGGIISPNEAREELRYEPKEGHDDLRIPANIAGSAGDPSQGGRPSNGNK